MPTIDLNILQERELARLLDYERATCTVDGDLVYHCAFPYRGHRRFVRRPQRSHRLSVGKVLRLARPNVEAASLFLLMHAFVKRMRVQRCV